MGTPIFSTSTCGQTIKCRIRVNSGETSLYFLQTRYYDPEVGRFISQDDVSYLDPDHINGLNLYAYCSNNPVMGYDPNGTKDGGMLWAILVGFASLAMLVTGFVLTTTGIGAPLGGILIGAGIGGLSGFVSNVLSQGISKGFGNINWDQVAFNSAIGIGIGAVMGSPLSGVLSGALIGGLSFTQSVGNDLFDNNGDWSKVHWGEAVTVGIISGVVSGIGKGIKNAGKGLTSSMDAIGVNVMPVINSLALIGSAISIFGSAFAAGARALVKGIIGLIILIFGGRNEQER